MLHCYFNEHHKYGPECVKNFKNISPSIGKFNIVKLFQNEDSMQNWRLIFYAKIEIFQLSL